jgi:uncharacterized membrane protein YdbT with pleckstrin-like domain
MSYVRKVLLPGETLVYQTSLHWLVYARTALLVGLAILLAIAASFVGFDAAFLVFAAAVLSLVLAAIAGIGATIRRASTELAVTDQRVIWKTGIFGRHTIEMNRSKVESVDVDQSILGRIFGYGTVLVRGTGGSLEPLASISDPLTFRSYITADPERQKGRG